MDEIFKLFQTIQVVKDREEKSNNVESARDSFVACCHISCSQDREAEKVKAAEEEKKAEEAKLSQPQVCALLTKDPNYEGRNLCPVCPALLFRRSWTI